MKRVVGPVERKGEIFALAEKSTSKDRNCRFWTGKKSDEGDKYIEIQSSVTDAPDDCMKVDEEDREILRKEGKVVADPQQIPSGDMIRIYEANACPGRVEK